MENGAVGAEVSFRAATGNPGGDPIELTKTELTGSSQSEPITTDVAAGYETEITCQYSPNGTEVSPDLRLELRVSYIDETGDEQVVHVAASDDKPELVLNVELINHRLSDSNRVAVSTDAAFPVPNTLELFIQNPSPSAVIKFDNEDQVTPEDPLPPINQSSFGPRLDRLYFYFPYGDTRGTLTTSQLAAAITLSPAPENVSWDVSAMSDPEIGPYWILFPKSQSVLGPNESVRFVLTGIQTFNPPDSLTHMRLKEQVTGYQVQTDSATTLTLRDEPPQIDSFAASESDVAAGTNINLSWSTWNAKSCNLDSTQGLQPNEEARPERPLTSGVYELQAVSPTGRTATKLQPVKVKPVSVKSFQLGPLAPDPEREVILEWGTFSAITVTIHPHVGEVCINAAGCNAGERIVAIAERTDFLLTAAGELGPKASELTVFPPRKIVQRPLVMDGLMTGKKSFVLKVTGGVPGAVVEMQSAESLPSGAYVTLPLTPLTKSTQEFATGLYDVKWSVHVPPPPLMFVCTYYSNGTAPTNPSMTVHTR